MKRQYRWLIVGVSLLVIMVAAFVVLGGLAAVVGAFSPSMQSGGSNEKFLYPGSPLDTADAYYFGGNRTYDLGGTCPDIIYRLVYTDATGQLRPMWYCVSDASYEPPQDWENALTPSYQSRICGVCPDLDTFQWYFGADDSPPPGFDWSTTAMIVCEDYNFPNSWDIQIKWAAWSNFIFGNDLYPDGTGEYIRAGTTVMKHGGGRQFDVLFVPMRYIEWQDGSLHPWYGASVTDIEN